MTGHKRRQKWTVSDAFTLEKAIPRRQVGSEEAIYGEGLRG